MRVQMISAAALCLACHSGVNAQTSTSAMTEDSEERTVGEERAFGVSIGLRAYVNKVSGMGYVPNPGKDPFSASVSSGYETSFLPSLGIRYGRFVFSGNYHASTDYSAFVPEVGEDVPFERKEWDASLGYEIASGIIVSAGWKELKVSGVMTQEYSGPFLGVAATAPLAGGWFIYGTIAYGRMDLELDGKEVGNSGDYFSSEIGFLYPLGNLSSSLERVSFLIGYRTQSIRTKDVPISVVSWPGGVHQETTRSTRDGLDGVTIGVTIAF